MILVDTIIEGGILIKEPSSPPISDGAVGIKDGKIIFSGAIEDLRAGGYEAKNIIKRKDAIICSGLINAHTHAPMTLLRGIADDLPLKEWLEKHIFPREARLTPELIEIGAELACAEMIRSGTTSFIDMYLFEDVICETVERVGMRAWLGEGLFDFPSPSFPSGFHAIDETRRLIDKWRGHERINIAICPHTPYTCSKELLLKAKRLQDETDALMVIHLSETRWEVDEIKGKTGLSPVRYVDSLGLLSKRTIAVHVVHPSDEDIEILRDREAIIVHCPESNLKLSSGIAPISKLIGSLNGSKGQTGYNRALIGTDGPASNNDLNMLGEMGTVARLHKGITEEPTCLPAPYVLSMATEFAGKALQVSGLGQLREGAPADIVVFSLNTPNMLPCHNPVSQIVYAASRANVQDVFCNGIQLMDNFALTTIDEEGLFNKVNKICAL